MFASAWANADGSIQVNEIVSEGTVRTWAVTQDDPEWLAAVAAAQMGAPEAGAGPGPVPLTAARAIATDAINAVRGEVRGRFLTRIPGQDMVYLEKEAEARDWVAARAAADAGDAPAPDLQDFLHIAAEIGTTALDADTVAQVYLNMAARFRAISATIEGPAMRALALVDAAPTSDAALQAAADFPSALSAALSAAGIPH